MALTRRPDLTTPVPPAALALRPDAPVPVRRQLVAQLATALRAGRWEPGDRLPSVRRLARRLDADRGTVRAAYRELAGRGLVEVRPGSGVYAAGAAGAAPPRRGSAPPASPGGAYGDTAGALRAFLARERAAGRRASQVAGLLGRWREAAAARRVTVVARDPDLTELWTREAEAALRPAGITVEGIRLRRARAEPDRLGRGLVAAGPESHPEAAALAPSWTEVVRLRPGPSPRIRRLLVRVPTGTVVATVTRSPRPSEEVRALAAGLRGGEVAVATCGPDEPGRLERLVRVARFVLVDVTCREAAAGVVPAVRRLTLRHLAPEALAALARYLGDPEGGGTADGTPGPADPAGRDEETRTPDRHRAGGRRR